jgi:hypothetical protein
MAQPLGHVLVCSFSMIAFELAMGRPVFDEKASGNPATGEVVSEYDGRAEAAGARHRPPCAEADDRAWMGDGCGAEADDDGGLRGPRSG